ncbi:MAG: tyrosine-type recombinase/integrase [Acidimicrobiales bacterium]
MRGHLRQRGESWELRVFVGNDPVTGRKKYITRTFRGSKRDAESALSKLVAAASTGGLAAQDTTVGDLVDRWFEMAKSELSPSTAKEYERIITLQLRPALGSVRLARLRPAQLDTLYAKLRAGGGRNGRPLSPASVRQVHAVIRRALSQGVRWGWIESNPAANATPPKVRRSEIVPPDPADVVRLIEAAEMVDPDLGCFLRLSATTGARRGELCALRWSDIDLDHAAMTISRSLVDNGNGAVIEKDTKTHSVRRIALDSVTVNNINRHLDRAQERAWVCGVEITDRSFVFSRSPAGDIPLVPNDVTGGFMSVRKSMGLEAVRLHDLRHFAATRMLAAGVPVRTVSGRLGHANAATTLGVYGHFLEASDREAAEALGGLLDAAKAQDGQDSTSSSRALVGTTMRRPRRSEGSSPRATRS